MRMKCVLTAFFIILISSMSLYAEDIQVSTIFNKKTLQVNDKLNLTIKIVGTNVNIQRPRIPINESFDSFYSGRASRFTYVNGKQDSITEFQYVLVPKKPGIFKVGPIEVQVGDSVYRTEPVEIEVLGTPGVSPSQQQGASLLNQAFNTAGPARAPAPPSTSSPASGFGSQYVRQAPPPVISPGESDVIFLRAWADKTTVYPGEQILLTYSIYTRADTRYEGFDEEPQATGFWIEELPIGQNVDRSTVVVGGRKYIKADVRKMALFATAPGSFNIEPGSVKVSVEERTQQNGMFDDFFNDSFFGGGGLFARRENKILAGTPINVIVKELPEQGKPSEFSGTIGRFTFDSSIDKKEVKQNEPVTMTLKIEGEGNIETLQHPPVPDVENFKIYEGESSSQLYKRGETIVGSKTFELIFIPEKAGTYSLPSLLFNYFDPVAKKYKAIRTPEYQIKVNPGEAPPELRNITGYKSEALKKDLTKETSDIYTIKTGFMLTDDVREEKDIRNILAGTNGILGFIFLIFFLAKMRSKAYEKDRARYRRKRASRSARSKLRKLNREISRSKGKVQRKFYVDAAKIIDQYFADKFDLSMQGLTFTDIENQILMLEVEQEVLNGLRDFYDTADLARFTSHEPPQEKLQEMTSFIEKIILELEKKK